MRAGHFKLEVSIIIITHRHTHTHCNAPTTTTTTNNNNNNNNNNLFVPRSHFSWRWLFVFCINFLQSFSTFLKRKINLKTRNTKSTWKLCPINDVTFNTVFHRPQGKLNLVKFVYGGSAFSSNYFLVLSRLPHK